MYMYVIYDKELLKENVSPVLLQGLK